MIAAKESKLNIPDPNTGVSYKVQIAAGKKVVSDAFLRKTYKYQEQYGIENHEGWVKYTTGDYNVYKGARDKREQLANAGHNFPWPLCYRLQRRKAYYRSRSTDDFQPEMV